MSSLISTTLMGVSMKNPVIAASGTFGFGHEYQSIFDISRLGGISGKGLILNGSSGNKGRRLHETPSGLLNSIGLENPGVEAFIQKEAPFLRSLGVAVIANLGGHSESDYLKGVEMLNDCDLDMLELNISCPNVKAGGMSFGVEASSAKDIVSKVKRITRHPLLVKLTPNANDLISVAKACEEAGADGLSLVNTFLGMAIDVKKRQAVFENVYAGLSGPAIFPIALRMVHQVSKAVSIPIVGEGGISSTEDAVAFIMAGASAIQVGTATFHNPFTMLEIIDGLEAYCKENHLDHIHEIRGII